jgi:hypothetical protein
MKLLNIEYKSIRVKNALFLLSVVFFSNTVFAGLQITENETIQGTISVTNLVVTKFQTNYMRKDIGSSKSAIVLPDGSAMVELFHESKTYRWTTTDPSTETNSSLPMTIPSGDTILNNSPAKLFCWTNGNTYGRIWLASFRKFMDSGTNLLTALSGNSTVSANLRVGSVLATNSVVVKTERATINNLPVLVLNPSTGSTTTFTNFVTTVTSELVSITMTNFSPSEFEIPTNYTEATPQLAQQFNISPAAFGRAPVGNAVNVMQNRLQAGKPLMDPLPTYPKRF